MQFKFAPTEIVCKQHSSSEGSPWGSQDGLRFYFMVEVGFQKPEFMVSNRTYPPPDISDNHPIKAGQTLILKDFPPQNRANWESRVFDIDEGDLVTIGLIGINEGLPYVAGGGGGDADDTLGGAFAVGIKVFADSASIPVVSSLIEQGIDLAQELSRFPDCTGTVFIYKQQYTGKQLIAELIKSHKRKTLTFSKNQSIVTHSGHEHCHSPDYEVKFEFRLISQIAIAEQEEDINTYVGDREDFIPRWTFCVPDGASIQVWAINRDKRIAFRPSFNFSQIDLFWVVEGQRISLDEGDIPVLKNVVRQPNNKSSTENVTIHYVVDFSKNLFLTTKGAEGSFSIRVEAYLQLISHEAPFVIYSTHYHVDGQGMDGDENYYMYLKCVEGIWNKMMSYVLVKPRLVPGEPNINPAIRFRLIEQSLENVVRLVRDIGMR